MHYLIVSIIAQKRVSVAIESMQCRVVTLHMQTPIA
jgi:hypothetical protein